MPHPVHYSHRITFKFNPLAVLERPELAAHVTVISQYWNEIDSRIGAYLAALMGDESIVAVSVYLNIQNDGAKRAAIDTITSLKLSPEEYQKLQAILRKIGDRYGERNDAIHGAWGVSPEYPDALLWADTRHSARFIAAAATASKPPSDDEIIEYQKRLMVYRLQDFQNIEGRLRAVYEELCEFTRPVMELRLVGAKVG